MSGKPRTLTKKQLDTLFKYAQDDTKSWQDIYLELDYYNHYRLKNILDAHGVVYIRPPTDTGIRLSKQSERILRDLAKDPAVTQTDAMHQLGIGLKQLRRLLRVHNIYWVANKGGKGRDKEPQNAV